MERKEPMEELIELTKKQLRFQKIITALLAALLIGLLAAGVAFAGQVKQMTADVRAAAEKLSDIDVEAINETISGTQEVLGSADELSAAIDEVTASVQEFDEWLGGLFGR